MNLEVRHLKLIVAITEEQSVTKAGKRLNLTQSALSHQLKDIEERLGTPLFLRLNKKMVPTQAGERLLASAKMVLGELKRAEEEISLMSSNGHGVLRISTECYTCYHWLPDMLKVFKEKYPAVEINIVVEATRRPIQALLDGELDVAIVNTRDDDRQLVFTPLFQDEMVAIMRPDHRLASRPYLEAGDFAEENLIMHNSLKENLVFQKLLLPAGVSPRQASQVHLTEAIIEMVKAGLGISVLARWAAWMQIESGALLAVPLTGKGFYREWSAVMLKNKSSPPYLLEFVELLASSSMPVAKMNSKKRATVS
ncbi:MAG: LysR family transcriptional regulator [Blastocatellia bacterium]|nr:LysR family transcriptional regulator [Blastocatellia bacterium]